MGKGARRRRRLGLLRNAIVLALLCAAGLAFWLALRGGDSGRIAALDDQRVTLVEPAIAPMIRHDAFTDLPGDPILIAGDDPRQGGPRELPRPPQLQRESAAGGPRLAVLRTRIHQPHQRMLANLPTSRQEFALFQAQRGPGGVLAASDISLQQDGPDRQRAGQWVLTRDAASRGQLWQDLIVQTGQPAKLASLLQDHGFDADTAMRIAARLHDQLGVTGDLPAGSVIALRYRMDGGVRQVMQLSLYQRGEYRGALAMADSGQLVAAGDAWADQPLLQQSADPDPMDADFQPRLLDAIYSAALRQGLPGALIGEAIAMMARVHDLDGFAAPGDRLDLIYAPQDEGSDNMHDATAGQIIFIGLTGPGGARHCYVVPDPKRGYGCYAPDARIAARAPLVLLQPPVAGVLRRRFAATVDDGRVIWAAPPGAPVHAVAAGRILAVDQQGAGGAITIAHDGGLTSRYEGLRDLPSAIRAPAPVSAGQQIGQLSGANDEGLVFQLLKDGVAVDPMPYLTGGPDILASGAVEALIGRIIHVESGGDAAARNPLSSATGLGQFIESTWLRMMRHHRADLVALLDRDRLLDLRLDPDLSRQMLRHLAQENESHLRARGHPATAGNLYLAHFLGAEGASMVLAADPALPLQEVLAPGVIAANPFLRGFSIADLRNWADRKMGQAVVVAATSQPAQMPVPPGIAPFVEAVDQILATIP